jgi:pimeloyl-ACP methyl ester carboxylesterase
MKIFTCAAVLSFGFGVAIGAAAEATPLASDRDMVTGVSVVKADCHNEFGLSDFLIRKAQIGRLWVKVENRGFCVRFWLSTAGGNKDEALVAFHGDIGGKIDGKLQLVEAARPISDENLQNIAGFGSRLYRGPYFWIARPGAFGSSGHHVKDRRKLLEIRIAMAALDALKQHYGFKRFHLVGHSGGGHTVAGLVQLRSDIGCAVIASGPTSLRSMQRDSGHPISRKHPFYDPIDHVNAIRQRPDLHLFVVSDRNDKRVSYRSQLEFVERVKARNLPITHVIATATDKNSHDLFDRGLRLAVDCANEARDQVVVSNVSGQGPVPLLSQPQTPTSNPNPTQPKPQTPADIINARGFWDGAPTTANQPTPVQIAALRARQAVGAADPRPTLGVSETFNKALTYAPAASSPIDRANVTMPSKTLAVKGDEAENGITAGPQAADAEVVLVTKDLGPVLSKAKIAANVELDDTLMQVKDAANSRSNVTDKPMAPVAQRVVLYDEDPSDAKGKQYVGSVIWRTEQIKASGNQKPDMAVRADIEIPDRKFKMTMSFRRNTDTSLPASHTAELTFILPQDFSGGGVGNVPGILMKSVEQARGTPLAGLAVKVIDSFFLVGLSNVDADRARNLQLFKERSWFDVPLVYVNQRRAIIAIEKGAAGEHAFKDALAAWGEDYPIASTDAQTRVRSFTRTAASNAKTSVLTHYNLTPDCNPSGTIDVRVLKQPSQGTLEIVGDRGFTNYPADNIRAKCNVQEVELTRVWYKSNADFKGLDEVQLEAFFTSGTSIKTTLQISVK